ncbi:formyltetrahydrofolate deformylase [Desulfohalovibrio reitneri]|uniref:formyltetrahydrofolate deformylase n=1 Tax=Desulfohalovibrio reitneri TaxID=1307759 RepID=UPI0004A6D135|nr:formyltetrahydrofolate deformylase [Desulfohalovibrio reitneri]
MSQDTTARLCITCPDRPGIVAAVTGFLFSHGANITQLDQHSTDPEGGEFLMRLEFQTPKLDMELASLREAFQREVGERFEMRWRINQAAWRRRVMLFASGHDHCLLELLWRWASGELPCEVTGVCSNHPTLREPVERFGVPYHYVPVGDGGMPEAEERLLEHAAGCDMLVLARYMRILGRSFIERLGAPIINIHHSFLPAFAGADPYRQAFERGVKIIGATAHYVTEELDAGPIIHQDTAQVTHRHSVEDLKDVGRDLERQVLARSVRWHLEDRIIRHGNKTVVF